MHTPFGQEQEIDSELADVGQLSHLARRLAEVVASCTAEGTRERMFTAAAILGFLKHIDQSDAYYPRRFVLPGLEGMRQECRSCARCDACAAHSIQNALLSGLRRASRAA